MPAAATRKSARRTDASNLAASGEGRPNSAKMVEEIALPAEDAAAIEARAAAFLADYRPATVAGQGLVRRAAMLSIRLERCYVRETAAIATEVRAAGAEFDEGRQEQVDALFEMLNEDPEKACRRLLRMPEGIDRMLETWAGLYEDLTHGSGERWSEDHGDVAFGLTGRRIGGLGVARVEALALAILGDFSLLTREDGEGLEAPDRRDWARAEMSALIVAEARKLEIRRESLDLKAIEADRAGAADRALFDPSPEATLARRYEAATERSMHRAIREMKAIEAEVAARPAASPAPSLGSFPSPRSRGPATPPEKPTRPRSEAGSPSTRVAIPSGRDEIARN